MAGKAIWIGYVNFGSVNLRVKLHGAINEERIQFHLLHRRDRVKLRQQMVCAFEKKPVAAEAQVKGFEVEEGKYIIVDPDELEQALPESSRLIEVHEFVKKEEIDPVCFDRAYYLAPDADSKGYGALVDAVKEAGVEGICTWTMRRRSWLGALGVSGKILVLQSLRYADEIVPVQTLEIKDVPVSEKELRIGNSLIEQLTVPFQPQKFTNEHQRRLRDLIDRKARGEKIAILRPVRRKPTSPDRLLEALEASLKVA
ncbi:MAG TPA: Ku protein [Dissulfurispiraceae bacterium]|nr:Ku protein [Dissulfurispiraceae bacterium]